MSVLATATEFLSHLQQSKLLSAEQFNEALAAIAECDSEEGLAVAKVLVKSKFLTRLQAQRLLEGRTRGFFINHYRIEELLGSGGMGWVYIARDTRTNEEVALKMLCEQNEKDAGLLARFRLEAEAGQRLNHPAIIRTQEIGEAVGLHGHVHYMVMDLVRGVGIDEFVAIGGPIGWGVAAHIVREVAKGLHHAHERGMVHRDIKPANVLVDGKCNAHILDFGLSLASQSVLGDEFSLAMIFGQDCLGTADYIAPEQARDSFHVDRRADIYSLGAMAYFMLAGHVMFPNQTTRATKVNAHWNIEPPPLTQLVPAIPATLAAIIHRMLAKDRTLRFASAAEVVLALKEFAKPMHVTFDFPKLLDRRAAVARLREKMLDERTRRASAASGLSVCTVDSKAAHPTRAQIETEIRKDTQVNRAADEHS